MAFTKIKTPLEGCFIIEPQFFGDGRGFFMETYSKKEFEAIGIHDNFVQDNYSQSQAGVLRGLHFQAGEMVQSKLVQVTSGAIYDVAIDIRKNSPTFGKYFGIELSAENKKMLYIPHGFAHGFISLKPNTHVFYKCDNYYSKEHDCGIIYNDSEIGVNWKKIYTGKFIISEKDKKQKNFHDFCQNNLF